MALITGNKSKWRAPAAGGGSSAPGVRELQPDAAGGTTNPFERALCQLGVGAHQHCGSITAQEKDELDTEGFVVLHDLFTREQADRMLAESRRLGAVDGGAWRWSPQRWWTGKSGGKTTMNLQDKAGSDAYDLCFTHPRVLAAVAHVLQGHAFYSVGVNFFKHAGWGTEKHQGLHTDGHYSAAGYQLCCNSLFALQEFTPSNGPIRVVPGSHLWQQQPAGRVADVTAAHPAELPLLLPAGSAVVFDARLWHGATGNPSCEPRGSLQAFWSRRHYPADDREMVDDLREYAQRRTNVLREETWRRISPAARALFDPPQPLGDEDGNATAQDHPGTLLRPQIAKL
eukprot:SAG22_NODE_816_length_7028_cov_32.309280_8_plen_342_part_00